MCESRCPTYMKYFTALIYDGKPRYQWTHRFDMFWQADILFMNNMRILWLVGFLPNNLRRNQTYIHKISNSLPKIKRQHDKIPFFIV